MDFAKDLHSRIASFREVEFHVYGADATYGRRQADHEYPQREKGYTEDLGKRLRRFPLQGFVYGRNWLTQAQRLIEACEKPGPGLLVHPWLGTFMAVCEECRPRFHRGHHGRVDFDLTFKEPGEARYPAANDDYVELAKARASSAVETFRQALASMLNIAVGWLGEEAARDLRAALTMIGAVAASIPGVSGAQLDSFLNKLDQAEQNASDLIINADALTQGMDEILSDMAGLMPLDNPVGAVRAFIAVAKFATDDAAPFGGSLSDIPEITPDRIQQKRNREALTALVRRLAVIHGIQAAMERDFDNRQQIEEARAAVVERLVALQNEAGAMGDDQGFLALRELMAVVMRAFDAKADLPSLTTQPVPLAVTPALVMSYRLYGSIDRAEEIVRRNAVFHPAFLPSGGTIEVLDA